MQELKFGKWCLFAEWFSVVAFPLGFLGGRLGGAG